MTKDSPCGRALRAVFRIERGAVQSGSESAVPVRERFARGGARPVAYAIERREPLVVITGEIGTGKTLLCRTCFSGSSGRRSCRSSTIRCSSATISEAVASGLRRHLEGPDDVTATSRHDLVQRSRIFSVARASRRTPSSSSTKPAPGARRPRQIRLLSNIDDERGTMLEIILVGQPDLEALLSRPELQQFQQRCRGGSVSRRSPPTNCRSTFTVGWWSAALPDPDHRCRASRISSAPWRNGTAPRQPSPSRPRPSRPSGPFWRDPAHRNLLCDRTLEAACGQRPRIIDAALIDTAGLAVDCPEPLPVEPSPGSALEADDLAPPAAFAATPAAAPRKNRTFRLAAAAAVAVVAIWAGARALNRPDDPQRAASPEAPAPAAAVATTTPPGTDHSRFDRS